MLFENKMELAKIKEILAGEPEFRLAQAKRAVFGELAENWNSVVGLPKNLRDKLNKEYPLEIKAEVLESADKKTVKTLIRLSDGNFVETVLMRHEDRNTVCVSSLVGCPMGCKFCATGEMGFVRKLSADEMISQVLFFARLLKKEKARVGSIVFMGMGEPFLNYENVMEAIRVMNNKEGFGIGARHISISTCGVFDGIKKLAEEKLPVNLAISLHASNDKVRREIMPVAEAYSISELIKVVDEYIVKTNRKVMFEYLMIDGVNDKDEHAFELAKLLKNKLCVVNLIEYNPTGKFSASSHNRIRRFKEILLENGINATTRFRFGQKIKGACGQLATEKN
jgi:23S rRNA (adenine2503-C2)-methyltransferase